MKKNNYLLLLTVILFTCCEPTSYDPVIEEEPELLKITDLQIPESGGIKMEATYTGSANIETLESGFIISRNLPVNQYSQDVPGTTSGNQITGELYNDLIYNEQYYLAAYIRHTPSQVLYSEPTPFVSLGSKAPEITRMTRSIIMDTVTIQGNHFTSESYRIKVKFGQVPGQIITSNDTLIKCLVPANIEQYDPVVKVEVYGKTAIYEDFSLLAPSIESLSRNTASLCDTLTIYGENFDFENGRNKIIIDNKEAVILNSARDSIRFAIPERLSTSVIRLKLISQLQETNFEEAIRIEKPVIASLPSGILAYGTIEITGSNFSIIREDNKVFFDDHQAEVLDATRTKLTVRVPIGPYATRNPNLRIELLDYNVPYDEGNFSLKDVWLLKSRLNMGYLFRGTQHFIYNNLAYIFVREDQNTRWKVNVMDPTTDTWSHFYVSYPRTEIQVEDFSIIHNQNSGRIFFYFSAEEKNFYEFFLNSKSFSQRKDYPGVVRGVPAVFSIQNNLYLGLGRIFNSTGYEDLTPLSRFYSYNINNDTWEQKEDFPMGGNRSDVSVFVINGKAYVGNGASHTGADDFWKYSPATDEWTSLAPFNGARTYTSFFDYGGKAYVYYGTGLTGDPDETAFRYDPANNTWAVLEPVNDRYYTYFIYPDGSYALRFQNAVYLGMYRYPHYEFFKVDLSRL